MGSNLGTLTLNLVAKTGGFTGPMDKAGRHAKKTSSQMSKDLKRMGTALAAGLTIAAGATAAFIKQTIDSADNARKTSQAIGLTTEAYQSLSFAASIGGLQQETFTKSMKRLSATMGDAASGIIASEAYFKALGVSVTDAAGNMRSSEDVLLELSNIFADMPDGVDKTAIAMKLFGKAGSGMIPFLNAGSKSIEELMHQAETLGYVISDEAAKGAEQFNDSLTVLSAVSKGFWNQVTAELLPALNNITASMIDIAEEGTASSVIATGLANSMKWLASTGVGVVAAFDLAGAAIGGFAAVAAETFGALGEDLKVTDALFTPLILYKIGKNAPEALVKLKTTAGFTGDQLKETGEKYAKLIDKIQVKPNDTGMQDFSEQIKESSDWMKKLRKELGYDDEKKATEKLTASIEKQTSALQLQLDTVGMSSREIDIYKLKMQGATEEQLASVDALLQSVATLETQTEAEEARKTLTDEGRQVTQDMRTAVEEYADEMERLNVLLDAGAISQETYSRAQKDAAGKWFEDAPKFDGGNTSFGEFESLNSQQQELESWYATQLELLSGYRQERSDMEATWNEKEVQLAQEHSAELIKIETARASLMLSASSSMFGDMADIVGTYSGEQSEAYKAMFAVSKAFSIAESTLNMFQAISEAGTLPWPANLAAMASATSSMAAIVSSISAVGLAHDGIDSVPQSGTWLLEKGERVTTERTSKRLDSTLDRIEGNNQGGFGMNVNIHEAPGTAAQVVKQDGQTLDVHIALIEEKLMKRMQRGTGMASALDRRYGRKY